MVWDIRKSNRPVLEVSHPNKRETPVVQIVNSNFSYGTIFAGYGSGDIASFFYSSVDLNNWVYFHV